MLTSTDKTELLKRLPAGPRHRLTEWSPEEIADYERRIEIELAGKEENIAYVRKLREAAREPGFSGDLRRAIAANRTPPEDLGRELGVDGDLIDKFCTGEGTLPSGVLDKLLAHLGLRLVKLLS